MAGDDCAQPGWATGTCDVNGISIHYVSTGQGKPSLVALHGLSADGACWTPLARALQADFDVVMPDARGHGKSSAPAEGYSYLDHAADTTGLIEALRLDAPILLGHSMGGMTAAVAASQLGPMISGVILIDPTFISPEWQREVYESDVVEQHRQLLSSDKASALAQARLRHSRRSPEIVELVSNARFQTHIGAFEVLAPPNPEYAGLVRTIEAPILLVIGSKGIVSRETARELQRLNARLRYELIADAGHGLPYDEPDRLVAVVKPFVHSLIDEPAMLIGR